MNRLLLAAGVAALAHALSGCTTQTIAGAAMSAAAAKIAAGTAPAKEDLPEPKPDPKRAAALRAELAAAYFGAGQLKVALEEAILAVKLDPESAAAHNVLGLIYMELADDTLAAQNFQRALRIDPQDPDANNNFGWFLCERGKIRDSIPFLLKAARTPLYPAADRSLTNAGVCARRMGDEAGAVKFFEQALQIQPFQPVALFNLSEFAFRDGRLAEARRLMDRFMKSAQPSPEVLWLAIRIERALGDRTQELSYTAQLQRRFPESAEARLLAQPGR
jgi:type IV pilus assembly protein PilF